MTLPRRQTTVLGSLRALSLFVAIAVAGAAACGGSGGGGYPTDTSTPGSNGGSNGGSSGGSNQGSGSRSSSIMVSNNSFTPSATTVGRGTTVTWTWNSCETGYDGQSCTSHTVTFEDGPTSPIQDQGTFSVPFNSAGTFKYHCKVHGTSMAGTVTVE